MEKFRENTADGPTVSNAKMKIISGVLEKPNEKIQTNQLA